MEQKNDGKTVFLLKSRIAKLYLFFLLVLTNLIIRIPSIPHGKGYDSFFIQSLANSISNLGTAGWWMNWMSIFGLYPYSYASSVPFILSGISQLASIRMEITTLYLCIILGLFSILGSYLFASVFFKDFTFKFIFATIFSLSAGTLGLTTWEISTRAQFLVLFPFFLYLLFKSLTINLKFVFLYFILGILLVATHHYFYFAFFFSALIIFTFIFAYLKRSLFTGLYEKIPNKYINYSYIVILIVIFLIPFFFVKQINMITEESRYSVMIDIFMISVRNLGFIFPLALAGIFYLSLKKDKNRYEWSMLICLIPTVIFSYDKTYGYIITYVIMIFFGLLGFLNVLKSFQKKPFLVGSALVMILVLNVVFSSFFAHYRIGLGGGSDEWYMQETTFQAGEWIYLNVPSDANAITNSYEGRKLSASYGGLPILYMDDINNFINGFISVNESTFIKNSPISISYYMDNPYVTTTSTSDGLLNWTSTFPITDERVNFFLDNHKISYFFRDTYRYNVLFDSLNKNKASIYDNGRMEIWINW